MHTGTDAGARTVRGQRCRIEPAQLRCKQWPLDDFAHSGIVDIFVSNMSAHTTSQRTVAK